MNKIILIHGALGNQHEFDDVSPILASSYNVVCYELPHHGNRKNSCIPFSVEAITKDFLEFLESEGPATVYGFSLGGYIALSAAQQSTANIKGIITQGTKSAWSPEVAEREIKSLDLKTIERKAPQFLHYLQKMHGSYLSELVDKTGRFLKELGNHPQLCYSALNRIHIPLRMIRGGKDRMVSEAETQQVCQVIPQALYTEIPSFPHPIGYIKPNHLATAIHVQANSFSYKWTEIDESRMTYTEIGNLEKNETCLIFLHEALGSIVQWGDFPSKLAQALNLPAIVLEFPGYGFSSEDSTIRTARYLYDFSQQLLPSFLKNICPGKKFLLVGHSDGGTNALLYAALYPNSVKGVITMAAHYINEDITRRGIKKTVTAYEKGKLKGLALYHGSKTEHLFYNWARTWLSESFLKWNISEDIEGMKVPTLIIQGEEDQYGTVQQVNGIKELINKGEIQLIPNCGHAPHIEQMNNVINHIETWNKQLA